MGVCYWLSQH